MYVWTWKDAICVCLMPVLHRAGMVNGCLLARATRKHGKAAQFLFTFSREGN